MPSPPAAMFNLFGADPGEAMADRILAGEGGVAADRVEVAALSEAQVNQLLERLDEDRDDAISAAEAEAAMERRAERGGPGHHRHGPRF